VSGDNEVIRIGTTNAQFKTFIAAIRGITTDNNDAVAVMIDSAGQLGTVSSSRRYKYDIATMADVSAMLAKLRPVTFRYKHAQNDGTHPLQYGLVAEEVAEVFPDLAVFKDGQPETVKYHLLPTFLLEGWQAQQKTIAAQAEKIEALEARLARLEALLPQTKAAALQ
jgi:Chaperone of endosialidase